MRFVIVPDLDDADSLHWQSIWQAEWGPIASRIAPRSWTDPDLDDWTGAVDAAVDRAGAHDVVLVAHGLGCLAVAAWLSAAPRAIRAAFLVAAPDPRGPDLPTSAASFAGVAPVGLGVPGLLLASDDDPVCRPGSAVRLARTWGVPMASVGALGHIDSASGLAGWQQGRVQLARLLGSITATAAA